MADELRVEISELLEGWKKVSNISNIEEVYPSVMASLNDIAKLTQAYWRDFATGAPIPPSNRVIRSRIGYSNSISLDLSKSNEKIIYSNYTTKNNLNVTKLIEDGHGEIDLKPGLLHGKSARQGKNGPYAIVSFRHNTPGPKAQNPMPSKVYNQAKKLTLTHLDANKKIIERGTRLSAKFGGEPETKTLLKNYTFMGKRGKGKKYTWKTGKYTGMIRLANKAGYLTFRVVSYKSDPNSWIVPAIQGAPIRQAVIDIMKPIAEQMLKEAFGKDSRK